MFLVRESKKERFESRLPVERLEPGCALDEPRTPVEVARGDCLDHPGITAEVPASHVGRLDSADPVGLSGGSNPIRTRFTHSYLWKRSHTGKSPGLRHVHHYLQSKERE